LRILLEELGAAPPQVPRKENRAIDLPLFSRWEGNIDDLSAALDITQEDVFFMEAKSIFVQLLRTLPATSAAARRPLNLRKIGDTATTMKDMGMFRKGMRGLELINQLQEMGVITDQDNFQILREEVEQELVHLGSLKEKVMEETKKLEEVYKTIRDHNAYLVSQLDTYKSYLHNVRSQSEGKQRNAGGKQQKQQVLGPYKFTHQQLEKEGVIQKSNVPDNRFVASDFHLFFHTLIGFILFFVTRRANIFFNITSPMPGTFVISLHYKGMSLPGSFEVGRCGETDGPAPEYRP
jgi:Ras GTPase-activating-like protein IQGAP2/3